MNRESIITVIIIVVAVLIAFNLNNISSITGRGTKSGRILEPTAPMISVEVSPSQLSIGETGVDKKGFAGANLVVEVISNPNNIRGFKEEAVIARVTEGGGRLRRYTTDIDCGERETGIKGLTNCKELAKKGGTGIARQYVLLEEGNYVAQVYDNSAQIYIEAPFTVVP